MDDTDQNTPKRPLRQEDLRQFNGSERFYKNPLFPRYLYTEGVRFVAQMGGAYWLLDKIFSLQVLPALKGQGFQFWTLTVREDTTATLSCTDDNNGWLYSEDITYTDFPLPVLRLYFTNSTLLLPSEY